VPVPTQIRSGPRYHDHVAYLGPNLLVAAGAAIRFRRSRRRDCPNIVFIVGFQHRNHHRFNTELTLLLLFLGIRRRHTTSFSRVRAMPCHVLRITARIVNPELLAIDASARMSCGYDVVPSHLLKYLAQIDHERAGSWRNIDPLMVRIEGLQPTNILL
jgi:hypothetical protein